MVSSRCGACGVAAGSYAGAKLTPGLMRLLLYGLEKSQYVFGPHLASTLAVQPGRPRILLTSFSRGGGLAQPSLCPAQKNPTTASGTSRARQIR